ncbi:anti-repressor protein [Modicisalibacter xianhensis]|uniref:Anti-repressor protein n=1 Tax=Modicisalibacter xianhensis TaxID=442341 RepID=A0A4R8F868_9GAMM|nr:antA/AntB antirepressor family protein [Halomonas xianhensis]TDX21636.1 anti-repressor protein [Halomonas xianhensis]
MYFSISTHLIADELVDAVNARDVHAELQVGKDFSTWIRDRIDEYGFVENQDFVIIPQNRGKIGRGRPRKEYAVTIDMAKELGMVERSERGRMVRRYFIECEKKLRTMAPAPSLEWDSNYIDNLTSLCKTVNLANDLWNRSIWPALEQLQSPVAKEFKDYMAVASSMSRFAINQPGVMFPSLR